MMPSHKTAVLIDDESSALEILALKLTQLFPEIQIIGKFQNPLEAIKKLTELNPDILFLDITMPNMSGFDVISVVNLPNTEIIFVTAHNDFALQAIRHCAIGYIVKPIENSMLQEAIENAITNLEKKTSFEKVRQLLQNIQTQASNRFVIPTQKGLSILKTEEMVRLEGMDGYTKICLTDQNCIVSSYNIGKFKKMLEGHSFIQLHKSHLINATFLKSLTNEGYALLSNGEKVPYSKQKKNEILEALKKL
jgi:two-component system LytT family response regulator